MPGLELFDQTIAEIQTALENGTLEATQNRLYESCVKIGKTEVADAIRRVRWDEFEEAFFQTLGKVLASRDPKIKAVYYEYDDLNEWCGALFPCYCYSPASKDDCDWYCEWEDSFDVPNIFEFERLGLGVSWSDSRVTTVFLYAISLLTEVCARAAKRVGSSTPVCMGGSRARNRDPFERRLLTRRRFLLRFQYEEVASRAFK